MPFGGTSPPLAPGAAPIGAPGDASLDASAPPGSAPDSPTLDDAPDSASHAFAADNALTGHQLDAIDALRQYTGLRMRDAVEGFDDYHRKLQASRDAALSDVAPQEGAAQAAARPRL